MVFDFLMFLLVNVEVSFLLRNILFFVICFSVFKNIFVDVVFGIYLVVLDFIEWSV